MDIMEMTRELGKALQQDDRYTAYMLAKQANDNDQELQEDIAHFEDLRINLGTAMSSEEPDSDEIKALDSELKAVYKKVMSNPRMMVFSGAQQALEKLVTNMQQIIQLCANGEDPRYLPDTRGRLLGKLRFMCRLSLIKSRGQVCGGELNTAAAAPK